MSPIIATNTAVSVATAALEMARRVQQGSRGEGHSEFVRIELAIEPVDLLLWLQSQSAATKIYWRDRGQEYEIAGIHAADIRYIAASDNNPIVVQNQKDPVRYFGTFRFEYGDPATRGHEDSSCPSCFVVPLVAIVRQAEHFRLVCTFKPDDSSRYHAFSILMALKSAIRNEFTPGHFALTESSTRQQWSESIQRALTMIRSGAIQKIVLARASTLQFSSEIDPFALLHELQQYSNRCFLFGFQFEEGTAFIGASPERLYRRNGSHLETEAVAGTRPRSDDPNADETLAKELLASDKDVREHSYVASHIESALKSLGKQVDSGAELTVVKLPKVQHLVRKFQGELTPGITDVDILHALHPTPAVCGSPTAIARKMLPELERLERCYYAGPVGWIGADAAEFAVGIRSALICDSRITIFGGAGIVEGSDADTEWNEIEQKMSPFFQILKPR
jgi:menaquinone-specific isochorismate synthase